MLKLTTDKHEASRGLSVTAELLVMLQQVYCNKFIANRIRKFSLVIGKTALVGY